MPAHGAVVAYRRFQTGATILLDAAPAGLPGAVVNAALNQILGTTPVTYALTQAGLRGPVELLPSNEYPGVFLKDVPNAAGIMPVANVLPPAVPAPKTAPIPNVYTSYLSSSPPGIMPRVGDCDFALIPPPGSPVRIPTDIITTTDVAGLTLAIIGAQTYHAVVKTTFHPRTIVLLGDAVGGPGTATDAVFDWNRIAGIPNISSPSLIPFTQESARSSAFMQLSAIKNQRGDGTVPAASARFAAAGRNVVFRRAFSVEHSTCYQNPAFQKETEDQILKICGAPVAPITTGPSGGP